LIIEAVAHINMGDPLYPNLCRILGEVGEENIPSGRQLHKAGTYLAIERPAFSTREESNLYRSLGCSIIETTNNTESRVVKDTLIK